MEQVLRQASGEENYELCFVHKGQQLTKTIRKTVDGYIIEDGALRFPTCAKMPLSAFDKVEGV
jgi:hypothetical protein